LAFANPSWLKPELMLMNLLRGQRLKLADLIDVSSLFTIEVVVDAPTLRVDFSCFGLDADSKLADELFSSHTLDVVGGHEAIKALVQGFLEDE
jgi:hypothetical protein